MKKSLFALLLSALLVSCYDNRPATVVQPANIHADGDSTFYGLVCEGTNDTILVFLNNPYDGADPDTLNILQAMKEQRVLGSLRIGDKVAVLRDTADTTSARLLIVVEDLMGQWCYKVKPTLRKTADKDGQSTAHVISQLSDSIRQLLDEEREYGFVLKIDSMVRNIGARGTSADDESPVVYSKPKRYVQWFLRNGKLLLTVLHPDSLISAEQEADTADIIKLTPDSLVLRFSEGEQGYYRKEETDDPAAR